MTDKNKIITVVDIGSHSIKCIIGTENEQKRMVVLGHALIQSHGVKRGVIINIDEAAKAIQDVVEKASNRADVEVRKIYVNVSGQHVKMAQYTIEEDISDKDFLNEQDVKSYIEKIKSVSLPEGYEISELFPRSFIVDDDNEVRNPIGVSGENFKGVYNLVLIPSVYKRNVSLAVQRAGFELAKIQVNELIASETVLSEEEKEAGVVVVDLGAGTTSVSIYLEGTLRHMAVVPFGGNVITNDIKEGCSILVKHAEKLKVKFGEALGENSADNKVVTIPGVSGWEPREISCRSLSYIIQARMEEIIDSFKFHINKSGIADKIGAGVVLTGGGAQLQNIIQLVRFKLGMDARIGFPNVILPEEQEIDLDNPSTAVVFGMLKLGLNDALSENSGISIKKRRKRDKTPLAENMVKKLTLFFTEESDHDF